jgi:hypothetical protein
MAVNRGLAWFVCSGVVLGFAACNTYDDNLLQPGPTAGNGGTGNSAASGSGSGGVPTAGGSSAVQAGASGIAGTSGANGISGGGSLGEGGAAGVGESAGNAGLGGTNAAGAGGVAGRAGNGGTGTTGGTATGGSATAGTTGNGGSSAAGSGGATSTSELIDDFEDRDLVLAPIKKRNGPWYDFNDGTATGVQTFGIALLSGADARTGSSSTAGLRMTASGYTGFGAGFGADFVNTQGKKVAYDVSAYKGVRFYAKIAAGTQSSMKVLFPTTYSDPMGGKCDDAVAMMACNDHLFELVSPVQTTWAVYEVDFADLSQQGFGLPQATLDPASVYSVQFTLSTAAFSADVWLDDISFVLK